ncbi:MAG: hypothetical protein HN742_43100 [Lentisphaerae bacterium]|jgi:hypothetical protein|nr:hypothetical protein [Lentisphaerota bacterium]MBT4822261.1 hypothetical protein [Lentisphaerota bacterium]MBT5604298.1 hypothetical protein [Lentisphaerota bacterium]MBT7054466.1 hypothetical protein [Lentisphaerota bacterium]MBT7848726.1 hypothetical protein [Lentisphaerota bacterium]
MIDETNRWLPPSPHREAVLEQIRRGRAHIEERGHGEPPLLVFQDGGVLELPRARAQENQVDFWQAPAETPATRQTAYSDICGSTDELKHMMTEQPELADGAQEEMLKLLDDMDYMLGRLAMRRIKYEAFVEAVRAVLEKADEADAADHDAATRESEALRDIIAQGGATVRTRIDEVQKRAERYRDVANAAEGVVKEYKDIAIEIGTHYRTIKGARSWGDSPD